MIGLLAEIADACDLTVPDGYFAPIGIVGTGAILEVGHLPVYEAAGIPVPAIWGRDRANAERLAQAHGIGRVHDTLDELLADPEIAIVDIAIVDIAVVPGVQVDIVLRALDAGKDVMCQKPLALDVKDAERIVERAEARGRKVAVQQQMRYEEGMLAARAMIERGWIGEVSTISFYVNIDKSSAQTRRGTTGGPSSAPAYASSKGGIISLTYALARHFGPLGIRVSCIAPGFVDTPMQRAGFSPLTQAFIDSTPPTTPAS